MFYVLQNESTASLRRVPILLTDAATGTTAQTGIAVTTIFPYVNINGGAFIGGTGSVGEAGFGQYYYQLAPGETNTLGLAGIHITAAGCRDYDAIAQIAAFNVYSSAGLGLTAGDVWSYVLSDANTAEQDLVTAASGGGGVTAGDVWSYDISAVSGPSAGFALQSTFVPVSSYLDQTISSVPSDSAYAVWNYYLSDSNLAGDDLVRAATAATSGDVWNYVLSDSNTAEQDLVSAAAGGGGVTAGDVWNYTLLSSGQSADTTLGNVDTNVTTIQGNTSNIPGDVWSYATRTLTSAGSGLTAGDVWSYSDRTITGGVVTSVVDPVTLTNGSFASIASSVWNSLVASYTTNGTFGYNILRADQANKVGDVTLYSSGGVNGVDADVHRIANDTAAATALKNILTGIGSSITSNITGNLSGSVGSVTSAVTVSSASMTGIAGTVWSTNISAYAAGTAGYALNAAAGSGVALTAGDIWNYSGGRTITGGLADTVTTLTDRSGFAITGGTITTVSDKTGYSLSASQAFNLIGNITGNLSGSVGSVSGSVASVSSPVSITTASMGSIGSTVWNYVLSDTQTADANLVAAGSGGVAITAGDVWSYATRTLTSGAGITVIGAVQLVNGPYRLTSNQNNSDGILDILQNSVQEINLNLIDGNGSPASTAGYASVINIYDVAGAAVTAYTPVVEYADGGILSFELDTDVTSTIGRYNLIVALSGAGFNVKYGPLQILVRPL